MVAGTWYVLSPRLALAALSEPDADPADIAALYDRLALRAAFARQTEPSTHGLPPPITREVLLDALSHPRSVRLLVLEPYGQWQFAAGEGLPDGLIEDDPAGFMPRALETTENWSVERGGLDSFTAIPADRPGGNRYRFRRDGLGWVLVEIQLTERIR
ncbi:hypothetical protein [Aurantiacibacter luteus]|uniref:Uncharacterized protein n=1 Tax=Aurantiacibacter luteus TaxID=1581420 RepID=A0A0G9MTZ0_9SPHN|nr:hypothetical protein [Aurantiacibacter luteus]KLE34185.1 hypothetical protein AAW00_07905 [Aurantiacibacter luteus]